MAEPLARIARDAVALGLEAEIHALLLRDLYAMARAYGCAELELGLRLE